MWTFVYFVYCLVFLHLCMHFLLSGSFDLLSASNGTSKEDFSEFDSLRSSSSVPTGTHPVFVSLMTWSLCCCCCCFLFLSVSVCADALLLHGRDTHMSCVYMSVSPDWSKGSIITTKIRFLSWFGSNCIKLWPGNSSLLQSGSISLWCNLGQLLKVHC